MHTNYNIIQGGSSYDLVVADVFTNNNNVIRLLCKTGGGAITIYLPPINLFGSNLNGVITIEDVDDMAGTNNIFVVPYPSNTINNASSYAITSNGGKIQVVITSIVEFGVIDASNTSVAPVVGDKNFVYQQVVPSTTWVVVHNLNKYCAVSSTNGTQTQLIGEVKWDNVNQVTITFNTPKVGFVYCN